MNRELLDHCTILVVNYKTPKLTKICLELSRRNLPGVRTIVVDNGSNDESLMYLRSLDHITLLERSSFGEEPHIAHARALDLGLQRVSTRYVFCMHTDSFLYDGGLVQKMFCFAEDTKAAAVGTLEQVNRHAARQVWRNLRRTIKCFGKSTLQRFGLVARRISPSHEQYLKSFCCLWNAELLKQKNLKFESKNLNPGYAMQASLTSQGYEVIKLPSSVIFASMDHIQSGTMVEIGVYERRHRRSVAYRRILSNVNSSGLA